MDYKIIRVIPHVYQLHFGRAYDLAMHFIRMQEYHESPKFRHQIFTLIDYMEWYSQKYGKGAFTYPKDWSGFNVPSEVAHEVYKSSCAIPDFNRYDERMSRIVDHLTYDEVRLALPEGEFVGHGERELPRFYLIGTSQENLRKEEGQDVKDTLAHELAHALYFINEPYQEAVKHQLFKRMDRNILVHARAVLQEMGYHYNVTNDETHAYCATGLCEVLKGVIPAEEREPFQKLFRETLDRCAK